MTDPTDRDRYETPLGDRREHPVPCRTCNQPTYAINQECDNCHNH